MPDDRFCVFGPADDSRQPPWSGKMSVTQTVLSARTRNSSQTGKGFNRRLRAEGQIPAVIYGKGTPTVSLSVDPKSLRKALNTPHKLNTVITVRFEGDGAPDDKLVLVKDSQRHPVTGNLIHIDFQEVRLDTPIRVSVPVVLTGRAQGVIDGGLLTQISRRTELLCTADRIPAAIEIDITNLKVGQSLHESAMVLPEGVKLAFPQHNETIATISAQKEESTPEAAAAAGKK